MSIPKCYPAIKGCDDIIAQDERFTGLSEGAIANLRALYDEYRRQDGKPEYLAEYEDKDIPQETVEELANVLYKFRTELKRARGSKILTKISSSTNLASAFVSVAHTYSPAKLREMVEFVAGLYRNKANVIAQQHNQKYPSRKVTRLDVIKGFKGKSGKTLYGESYLFDALYDDIAEAYVKNTDQSPINANDIWDVLLAWGPICMMARTLIGDRERLNMGAFHDFAYAKEEGITGSELENSIEDFTSEAYDPEESTKESWQEDKNKAPMLARVLDVAKRELANIIDAREAQRVTSLPFFKRLALDDAHSFLATALTTVPNEEEMIKILERYEKIYQQEFAAIQQAKQLKAKGEKEVFIPDMSLAAMIGHHLTEAFKRDVSLKTAFYVSYHTGFTPFAKIVQTIRHGVYGIKDFFRSVINKEAFKPKDYIRAYIRSGEFSSNSLFKREEDGSLVFADNAAEQIAEVVNEFASYEVETDTVEAATDNVFLRSKAYKMAPIFDKLRSKNLEHRNLAFAYISLALQSIGINVTTLDISNLYSLGKLTPHFLNTLASLYNQLQKYAVPGLKVSYTSLLEQTEGYVVDLEEFASEIQSLLGTITYEPRALVLDKNGNKSSVSSMQAPCYFTDFMDTLLFYYNQIVQAENPEVMEEYQDKAMNFIRTKFAGTFILSENDSTVNPILSEIIKSIKGKSSFLKNFRHERFAEMNIEGKEQRAEALSDVDVMLNLFHSFYGPFVKKQATGMFPLFILGDSNVHRYMSAPIKSNEEIIQIFMDMVTKEEEVNKDIAAVNKYLTEHNYGTIAGTEKSSQTSFLKTIQEKRDANLETLSPNAALRKAVADTLERELAKFENVWKEKGLNDENKSGFIYFGTSSDKQANVKTDMQAKEALRAFVYNYALNTVSQLQIMTISTLYYKSLEELQKRYKEVHASGSSVNIYAENPYAQPDEEGKRPYIFLDKDGHFYPYERAVYFDDIIVNVELNDPDFAQVAKTVLKDNPSAYDKYLTSTLTDGQSYRSIHSYRKLAIAQKQWSDTQEQWYQKLMKFKASNPKGLTVEQIKELDSYDIIFQPQKPFFFSIERFSFTDGGKTKVLPIPVQHKCAEVILIPELLPQGSGLKAVAEAMEEQNIDVVCSTEVVKVGGFGAISIAYKTNSQNLYVDKDGNVIPSADGKTTGITRKDQTKNKSFHDLAVAVQDHTGAGIKEALSKGYVHELDISTYYRQQNVPAHVNDPRARGTQMNKIFYTNIKKNGDYSSYFPGQTTKDGRTNLTLFSDMKYNHIDVGGQSNRGGANLCKFYNGLIVQNIIEAFENLQKQLADNEALAPILQQMSLNNSRNTIYDIINYAITVEEGKDSDEKIREFLVPLCDPTISTEVMATLISLFRKEVNKQIMCGGSAVQASAFGIDRLIYDDAKHSNYRKRNQPDDGGLKCICEYKRDEDGNFVLDENGKKIPINVLYAECEIPFDLYYTDENGKKVALEYDDYCNNDGTLKINPETGQSYLEEEFPGITNLVAYRIPTERAYSAMNLKVKRFTRKINGGTIKVPAAFTTIAGFDFDIDKLYFLRKEFVYESKEMSEEDNKKVWDAVFEENTLVAQALDQKRKELEGNDSNTPLNRFREHVSLTQFGFDENTTLQDLYNQKARQLGVTRGLIEYAHDKAINQNSRVARNNEILRLIQQRLTDKETLPARLTPGDFSPHKISAKKMRILFRQNGPITLSKLAELAATEEEYRVDYSILNPWTFVAYNKQNQAASELIGIFANQSTNNIFSSVAHQIHLVNGIGFAGKKPLFDLISSNREEIDATVAGFLAASVDAVKDPVLNFMNLNSLTANTGALLARLGYNTDEIAFLFNQPIIKEICDVYFNGHMSNFDNAIAKVRREYAKHVTASEIPTGSALGQNLSLQGLADAIVNHNSSNNKTGWKSNPSNTAFQLEALDTFLRARQAASELVSFVRATKFTAAKSIESSLGGLYHQIQVIQNYVNEPGAELIILPSESLDKAITDWGDTDILGDAKQTYLTQVMENPFAFEQVMFDMGRLFLTKTLAQFSPHETGTFKKTRDDMTKMTRNNILSKKSIDELHKDLVLYILSKIEDSALNPIKLIKTDDGKEITQAEYYRREFPKIFEAEKAKREELGKKPNVFLSSIKVAQSKEGKVYLSIPNVLERNVAIKEARMQGWTELALSKDPDDFALAFDLFIYSLYNTGFNIRSSSFAHLATAFVKQNLPIFGGGSYTDFLRMLNKNSFSIDSEDFINFYIQNHLEDYQFVYKPYSDAYKALDAAKNASEDGRIKVSMYKPNSREATAYADKIFLKVTPDKNDPKHLCSVLAAPAILLENKDNTGKITHELYILEQLWNREGNLNSINQMDYSASLTYVPVPILGKNGSKNYNSERPNVPSNSSKSSTQAVDDTELVQQQEVNDTIIAQQQPAEVGALSNEKSQNSLTEVERALDNLQQYTQETIQTLDQFGNLTENCK